MSTATLLVLGGTGYALIPETEIIAEDKPPIVTQVENHEERIGNLEVKTDDIATQVNQNTADIEAVRDFTNAPEAPQVAPVVTPVTKPPETVSDPTTANAPTITPETNPLTIKKLNVDDNVSSDKNPTPLRLCTYTLHDGSSRAVYQPRDKECQAVGAIFYEYN